MSEQASEIDSGAADVLGQMAATPAPVPDLTLEAATPLRTLPPELVALIVGRVQAGVTAFGDDHPRAAITNRIVVPSTVLAVLDAVGLIAAVFTGHAVLALVAALLLLVLAYLALAGVRFVRADPLRVTPEQLAYVEASKTWSSHLEWTDEQRSGPWGRLVVVACSAAARIAASEAWTWASIAGQRAGTELAPILDDLDGAAFTFAVQGDPAPAAATGNAADAELVRRVAALRCYADALDALVGRAAHTDDLRSRLPLDEARRLTELLFVVRASRTPEGEPS